LFIVVGLFESGVVEKLLIVGLGDVAQRALPELLSRYEVTVLSRSAYSGDWAASLRHVAANLDEWALSAQQQSALAQSFDAVLYTVPPLLRADSGAVACVAKFLAAAGRRAETGGVCEHDRRIRGLWR